MLEKLGGRKMIIGILGLISLVILSYFKSEAVTSQFVAGLLGIITAFNVANVTNTIKSINMSSLNESKSNETEEISPIDENKVVYLHLQSQIDATTKQIDTLADIIQKSLLTKAAINTNLYTQTNAAQPAAETAQVSNAEENRQAISQFLNRPIA